MTADQRLLLDQLFQNLLKEQADDDLRIISNTGEVKVPYSSESWYKCAWCDNSISLRVMVGIVSGSTGRIMPVVHYCRMCCSTVYCSATCQREDWMNGRHRLCCREVRRCRKALLESSTELSEEENGVMDVFDRSNELVFRLGAVGIGLGSVGQNYLRERMNLVLALMEQAVAPMMAQGPPRPHWDKLALEFVLEHCIDLLHLDPIHTSSFTRTLVVHCFLIFERYQELYDFVKYWNVLPHKLRDIHSASIEYDDDEPPQPTEFEEALDFALGPNTFWSLKEPQSMFEEQSELALRPPSQQQQRSERSSGQITTFPGPSKVDLVNVLYLALAKISIYQTLLGIGLVAPCLPIEAHDITSHIGSFLGVTAEWRSIDPSTIKQQCYQLLKFANESIPGILLELIQSDNLPRDGEELDFEHDRAPILELLKTTWVSSKFAWSFLHHFVRNENNLLCLHTNIQVPRHGFLQQFFDRVYRHYLAMQSNQNSRKRIREWWEREKDSPAVRHLLLDEMEEGGHLYNCDFSISRVYAALMKEDKLSTRNEILLLGESERIDLIDDEVFLAKEHLLQVRYHPNVAAFLKTHKINIPDEDLPNCVNLVELVCGLFEDGLATESNLSLLFGNAGWVSLLLYYARAG